MLKTQIEVVHRKREAYFLEKIMAEYHAGKRVVQVCGRDHIPHLSLELTLKRIPHLAFVQKNDSNDHLKYVPT